MNSSTAVVKKTAKTVMQDKKFKSMTVSFIPVFATLSCIILSEIFMPVKPIRYMYFVMLAVLFVFVLIPLYMGTLRFYWRMYMDADDSIISQFYYFSGWDKYWKVMKLNFRILGKALLFGILLFIPAAIVKILSMAKFYKFIGIAIPDFVSNFWIISNFLEIAAVLLLLWIMLRSYMAPFLFIADEDMDTAEAMHMSYVISKNTRIDYVSLLLSFLPWALISAFVVPAVYTVPYGVMSYLVHCRFVTARYNYIVKEFTKQNTPTFAAEF